MDFPLVLVDGFTPGIPAWSTVGNIDRVTPDATGRSFRLAFGNRSLQLTVLGPTGLAPAIQSRRRRRIHFRIFCCRGLARPSDSRGSI